MAQNITLLGASYSAVPAVMLPKTGGGNALFADPSPVTAVAADVAQGKFFINSSGDLEEGTGSGGGGGVTRENIVPQQTITATAGYNGLASTAVLIEGADYEYTVNGETRLGTAVDVNGTLQLGDGDYYWYEQGGCFVTDGSVMYFRTSAAGSYTVKVDKLTLSGGGGGSTLIEKNITANGTYNASDDSADGYSKVTVNVSGGVTPAGTKVISIAENGTTTEDVTQYADVQISVNVPATSKNVQVNQVTTRRNNTALGSINSLTCAKAGTYDVYWVCSRSSTSGTWGSQLYINGVAYGSENTTFTNHVQVNHLSNVSIPAGATVAVYGRSRSGYYIYAPQLIIVEA